MLKSEWTKKNHTFHTAYTIFHKTELNLAVRKRNQLCFSPNRRRFPTIELQLLQEGRKISNTWQQIQGTSVLSQAPFTHNLAISTSVQTSDATTMYRKVCWKFISDIICSGKEKIVRKYFRTNSYVEQLR